MWDSVAEFTLTGQFTPPPDALFSEEQAWWVKFPAMVAPLIWLAIAVLLGWIFYRLLQLRIREWKKTTVILIYLALIWTVLTKV